MEAALSTAHLAYFAKVFYVKIAGKFGHRPVAVAVRMLEGEHPVLVMSRVSSWQGTFRRRRWREACR